MLKGIIVTLVLVSAFIKPCGAQVVFDTVAVASADTSLDENNRTEQFFNEAGKVTDPAKVLLTTKAGKVISLSKFVSIQSAEHALADLDNDGKKELLLWSYTGGAHCCDEIFIFRNIAPNKYQHVARLFGGHTIITSQKKFRFGFYEQFGYFFTCYACAYTDTSDTAPISLRQILIEYQKGKVRVIQGEQETRSIINDNLGKLSEQPYQPLDADLAMDEGLRKEFAMNLVVYYYAFGRNLPETQKLFNKYYKFPDAKKVWLEFTKSLAAIKKENDF